MTPRRGVTAMRSITKFITKPFVIGIGPGNHRPEAFENFVFRAFFLDPVCLLISTRPILEDRLCAETALGTGVTREALRHDDYPLLVNPKTASLVSKSHPSTSHISHLTISRFEHHRLDLLTSLNMASAAYASIKLFAGVSCRVTKTSNRQC